MAMLTTHSNPMAMMPELHLEAHKPIFEQTPASVDRPADPIVPVQEEEIRTRAYYIYEDRVRSGGRGDALDDWLRAERELEAAADRAIEAIIVGGVRERVSTGGRL